MTRNRVREGRSGEPVNLGAQALRHIGTLAAFVLVVAGSAALATPAPADAARYEGKTNQGKKIKVRTDNRGVVNRVLVRGTVRCWDGARFPGYSIFTRPFDQANPMQFRDADRAVSKQGKYRAVAKDKVAGWFVNANKRRMKGWYWIRIDVFRSGTKIDSCWLQTRWRASIVE